MVPEQSESSRPGRITSGPDRCAASHCQRPFDAEYGFYLYKDLDSGNLAVFCDDCARHVELNLPTRFALIAL